MRLVSLLMLLLSSFPVFSQIQIEKPWARATAPGAPVAGGYLLIRNGGPAADRLVGVTSPAAGKVELHVHVMENNVMKMREVPAYDVPAKGSFELKPGGPHLMFMQLKQPFKEGDKVPVRLRFEKAGDVGAELLVGPLGARAPSSGHH